MRLVTHTPDGSIVGFDVDHDDLRRRLATAPVRWGEDTGGRIVATVELDAEIAFVVPAARLAAS